MTVYLVNFGLIFLYACVFLWNSRIKNGRKIFCICSCINWVLISGLRGLDIGADTRVYKEFFWEYCLNNYSWKYVLGMFYSKFFGGVSIFSEQAELDPLYFVFIKIIQIFTDNYQIFLLIVAMCFMIPFTCWIYRESKEPFISFLIYSCLFFDFFSLTGIRQVVGTTIIFFLGEFFYKKKRYGWLLFTIFVAFLLHKSVICYVPFFVIRNFKITKVYTMLCMGGAVLMFALKDYIFKILCVVFGYEKFLEPVEAGAWTFTFLLVAVTIVAIVYKKKIFEIDSNAKCLFNAQFIALLLVSMTFVNPSAMRAVQYYSLYLILLLPDIIMAMKGREKYVVAVLASIMMFFLVIKDHPQYLFFWQ